MKNIINRLSHFFAQLLFSMVMPPLFIPSIARLRFTRSIVAFCFGRLYGTKYQHVIDSFQRKYGSAMAEGLSKVMVIFVDCSAGWNAGLAKRLVEKTRLFKKVLGKRVASEFYIVAQNH